MPDNMATTTSEELSDEEFWKYLLDPIEPLNCEGYPHRSPEGPNESLVQCPYCWVLSFVMRPAGETSEDHFPDCSLDVRHQSYCQPGGAGHPRVGE